MAFFFGNALDFHATANKCFMLAVHFCHSRCEWNHEQQNWLCMANTAWAKLVQYNNNESTFTENITRRTTGSNFPISAGDDQFSCLTSHTKYIYSNFHFLKAFKLEIQIGPSGLIKSSDKKAQQTQPKQYASGRCIYTTYAEIYTEIANDHFAESSSRSSLIKSQTQAEKTHIEKSKKSKKKEK